MRVISGVGMVHKLSRDLLFGYPELPRRRDIARTGPPEKRSEQRTISVERAHQRVGQLVL